MKLIDEVLKIDNMKRILVTGGAGFIGTNLIKELKNQDCDVISIEKILVKLANQILIIVFIWLHNLGFNHHLKILKNP